MTRTISSSGRSGVETVSQEIESFKHLMLLVLLKNGAYVVDHVSECFVKIWQTADDPRSWLCVSSSKRDIDRRVQLTPFTNPRNHPYHLKSQPAWDKVSSSLGSAPSLFTSRRELIKFLFRSNYAQNVSRPSAVSVGLRSSMCGLGVTYAHTF